MPLVGVPFGPSPGFRLDVGSSRIGPRRGGAMSRTTEYLKKRGVPFETIPHGKAFTSIDEARALGVQADEVVKTLLLDMPHGHALAVVPGGRRLDVRLAAKAAGERHTHLATEDEIQRDLPDFDLGCLPPIGSLLGVPEYVDSDVMRHRTLVFAAGSQTESVKVLTEDLFRDEPVTVAPLVRRGADE
jgi:prolyl-tRNA editing enzyme YbaK/EbsC (Cys-tRNA(Pro) deacylase)